MDFAQASCTEFVTVLASNAPVPGGGGASALVGAIGTALGKMVGSLTLGKKRALLNPGHFNWEEPGMEYMAQWLPQVIDNAVPVTFVQSGNQFTWLDYKNKK